jgi:tripartite-type tricarboxylate transporter receptor subunit TctC
MSLPPRRHAWRRFRAGGKRRAALALLGSLLIAPAGQAQPAGPTTGYPVKPVRWIVPYPAGASNDVIARTIAQKLAATWGAQVVIDNRAGAGGTIAAELVSRANPDGYTLLLANPGPSVNNPVLQRNPQYRVEAFAPVVFIGYTPLILVAHPGFEPATVRELVRHCLAHPGKVSWGSVGYGSSVHIGLALFQSATRVDVLHVPYKGAAQALTEIVGAQIQVMYSTLASADSQVRARRLKVLATASARRLPALPDVPTLSEQGVEGADASNWFGVAVPAATPPAIIRSLNGHVNAALASGEVRQRLEGLGLTTTGGTPAEFGAYLQNEIARLRRLLEAGVLQLQ